MAVWRIVPINLQTTPLKDATLEGELIFNIFLYFFFHFILCFAFHVVTFFFFSGFLIAAVPKSPTPTLRRISSERLMGEHEREEESEKELGLSMGTSGLLAPPAWRRTTHSGVIEHDVLNLRATQKVEFNLLEEMDKEPVANTSGAFGAKDGAEIENKHQVLREVDIFLNEGKPPALELIFSEPWAVRKSSFFSQDFILVNLRKKMTRL